MAEVAAGGDVDAVARRYGVKPTTLRWWRAELRKRVLNKDNPRLLPVVVTTAPTSMPPRIDVVGGESIEVFVEIGATRMTLRGGVSAEHIAAIVRAAVPSC